MTRETAADLSLFPSGERRIVGFDVLRAAAILMVASGHMLGAYGIPKDVPIFARPLWAMLTQLAVAGVDIFYVLSGFLIGGMLLSELATERRIDIVRFYLRRTLRLWPSYFLAILFAWQWYRRMHLEVEGQLMRPPSLKAMWPFFLHIQNYYDLHAHNALNIGATAQTWTLASLAQFYVVIPFVLLGLWRLGGAVSNGKIAALPWITALAFIACFAMRWYGAPADNNAYVASKHYFPTHLRLDELLAGVLAAHWVLHSPRRLARAMRFWPVILIASLAAFFPVGLRKEESPPFLFIWGYTLAGIGSVGLILIAWWFGEGRYRGDTTRGIKPASLPVRWFAQIGVWSYSIYLWHQPTGQILALKLRNGLFNRMVRMHMDPWHWRLQYFIAAAIYFPIAIGLGVAMYYLVEKPSLKLRERLVPRHALRSGRTEGPPVQAE